MGRANPDEAGWTADHPKSLRSETVELNRRIDLILVRPAWGRNPFQGGVWAGVVGDALSDRTPSGMWPSDHAGVWGRFRLKAYQQTVNKFCQRLREFCTARGISFFTASSATPLEQLLLKQLREAEVWK